jgi:hypothetical protein
VPTSRTELHIPAAAIGPALARAAVPSVLPPLEAARVADLQLLVSELIGDAVERAGIPASEDILVTVSASEVSVRVEIVAGRRIPTPREGSWAALLLDRLASAWGYDEERSPARIWFEVPVR